MKKPVILLIFIFIFILSFYSLKTDDKEIRLQGIKGIVLVHETGETSYYEAKSNIDDIIIKIKSIADADNEKSRRIANEEVSFVKYQYRSAIAPYPGAISNEIICPNELMPVYHNDSDFGFVTLFASQRFTYGACLRENVKYNSLIGFRNCNDVLYVIRLFSEKPFDLLIKAYDEMKCR